MILKWLIIGTASILVLLCLICLAGWNITRKGKEARASIVLVKLAINLGILELFTRVAIGLDNIANNSEDSMRLKYYLFK